MRKSTIVPADPGFGVVLPCYSTDSGFSLVVTAIVAWRIDGPAATGKLIPVTESGIDGGAEDFEPDDLYAIQHPDGHYRFADGERCDSAEALLESFQRRRR
jgi:hypothetical protein